MGKLDDIINEIGSKYYPVGSVVITSTNVGATYMHNLYGGTWALKRKRFMYQAVTDAFTFNTTNTQDGDSVVSLYKDSILCRVAYAPKVAFNDDALSIATVDPTKIGIADSSYLLTSHIMAPSDGLNAIHWLRMNSSGLSNIEVCTKTTATSIAASTSTFAVTFPIMFDGTPESMIDSFCDEFWWVRTA